MFQIYDLTCNNLRNAVGIDSNPVFGWKMKTDQNATEQFSYKVIVKKENSIVWDSGVVQSCENREIVYQGDMLESGCWYNWSVECKNNHDETAKSENRFFTGILEPDHWCANWIKSTEIRKPIQDITDAGAIFSGRARSLDHPEEVLNAPVCFRRDFIINKPVKQAVIFATAHGIYSLYVDGQKVSQHLAPEYTSYKYHLEYQSMDVTALLDKGDHAIGVILADGWYTGKIGLMGVGNQYGDHNAFAMQMEIEFMDGSKQLIKSDEQFRWNYGAYIYADLIVGEYIDYSKYNLDFAKSGFVDTNWKSVESESFIENNLTGRTVEPVQIVKTIKPKLIYIPAGEMVLDAGENIVGYTGIDFVCKEDTELSLEHSEVLDKEGNFLQNIIGQHKNQKDRILCRSGQKIVYEPQFTFHGFRYVRVSGIQDIKEEDFTIYVIGTDLKKTGDFSCSDELLNQLHANIFRSQQGNMLTIPTDCPQRERAGWTGDIQVYAPTAAFHMDVLSFLKRWLFDMRLEQLDDGQIPNVIPAIDSNKYIDGEGKKHICSAGWGDACIIVPYRLYQAYGDKSVLEDNFEMMQKWMKFVATETDENSLWNKEFHFGDWLIPSIMASEGDPMQTAVRTKEEVATAMYAYTTEMMISICSILGKDEEAMEYIKLNTKIRNSFSKTYISEDGTMRQQLQGLYVLALHLNMAEESKKAGMVQNLVQLIHEAGDCLDTGFLSVPFLLDTLCEYGENELAYKLLMQKQPPSWLYAVTLGATTIWENWTAILPDGTRTNSSYNHFAFGCVGDFIYRKIGGLQMEEPGYKKIHIEPDFACGLQYTTTRLDCPYGEIKVHWEKRDQKIHMDVVLPPGTTGSVKISEKNIEIDNGSYSFDI